MSLPDDQHISDDMVSAATVGATLAQVKSMLADEHGQSEAALKTALAMEAQEIRVEIEAAVERALTAQRAAEPKGRAPQPPWTTRKWLAYALVGLLAVLALATVAGMFVTSLDLTRVKDIMAIVFGPVAGLTGAAVGYYFGAKTGSELPQQKKV